MNNLKCKTLKFDEKNEQKIFCVDKHASYGFLAVYKLTATTSHNHTLLSLSLSLKAINYSRNTFPILTLN